MASARAVISKKPTAPIDPPERVFPRITTKRYGKPTKTEKALVAQFVADQPAEISPQQVQGLSKMLRRSKEVIRGLIEEARENLQVSLKDYVEIHKQATLSAAASDTVGGLKVAIEASQWAMENVGIDGVKAVEKAKSEAYSGPRIMVGIQVGGIDAPKTDIPITVEAVDKANG